MFIWFVFDGLLNSGYFQVPINDKSEQNLRLIGSNSHGYLMGFELYKKILLRRFNGDTEPVNYYLISYYLRGGLSI